MVRRGLILPSRMIDVYTQPFVERPVGSDVLRAAPSFGALWGVSPEWHADFQLTPFYLPNHTAGPGRLAITHRLIKTTPFDLGVAFTAAFDPTTPNFIGYIQPGIATIYRTKGPVRIDSGVQVPLYTSPDAHWGVRLPVAVYFQISPRVHCGSTGALVISDLRDARSTTSFPLGFTFGYSAGPELDFAAFTPYITWTNFYVPATGIFDTKSFVAGIIADVAFEVP